MEPGTLVDGCAMLRVFPEATRAVSCTSSHRGPRPCLSSPSIGFKYLASLVKKGLAAVVLVYSLGVERTVSLSIQKLRFWSSYSTEVAMVKTIRCSHRALGVRFLREPLRACFQRACPKTKTANKEESARMRVLKLEQKACCLV